MTENELNDMLKSETKKLKEINAFIKRSPGGNLSFPAGEYFRCRSSIAA